MCALSLPHVPASRSQSYTSWCHLPGIPGTPFPRPEPLLPKAPHP